MINMTEIIIDKEFERILPMLDERAIGELESEILEHGCLFPLLLWDGVLVDGHHRYKIIQKHGLAFETKDIEFDSREEAIIWIMLHQTGQRNLTPMQLSFYRGYHYTLEKQVHASNQYTVKSAEAQNGPRQNRQSTAQRLAEHYSVSRNTIKRDAQLATAINKIAETSPETKIDILSGKMKISKKQLKELAGGTDNDVADLVVQIVEGTFENKKTGVTGKGNSDNEAESNIMRPWEVEFSKMTDEFRQVLRAHAKSDDTASVRVALRSYITMLESLYNQI